MEHKEKKEKGFISWVKNKAMGTSSPQPHHPMVQAVIGSSGSYSGGYSGVAPAQGPTAGAGLAITPEGGPSPLSGTSPPMAPLPAPLPTLPEEQGTFSKITAVLRRQRTGEDPPDEEIEIENQFDDALEEAQKAEEARAAADAEGEEGHEEGGRSSGGTGTMVPVRGTRPKARPPGRQTSGSPARHSPKHRSIRAETDTQSWEGAFFTIAAVETDKLRMIDAPASLIPIVHDVIIAAWPKGIDSEKQAAQGVWRFTLKQNPWVQIQEENCRRLIKIMLEKLYWEGYHLVSCSGFFPEPYEKASWIFKVHPKPEKPGWFCCVDILDQSTLRVIDIPHQLAGAFKDAIQDFWELGVVRSKDSHNAPQDTGILATIPVPAPTTVPKARKASAKVKKDKGPKRHTSYRRMVEVELKGAPFAIQGSKEFHDGRRLICNLLRYFFEKHGFVVYTTHISCWILRSDQYEHIPEDDKEELDEDKL